MREIEGYKASYAIEKIFYSRAAIRILFHLTSNGMETETRLMRIARSNYKNFSKHLERLTQLGLIEKKRLGRITIIKLNEESKLYRKILDTYKIWVGENNYLSKGIFK